MIYFNTRQFCELVAAFANRNAASAEYNMLKNNITHFSLEQQQWQTTLHALENVNVANMFGETAGIKITLNSNTPGASLKGWQTATVPISSNASPVDMASARLWLLEGAPIDDVITMLEVRRDFELPTALCSARAREIVATAQRMIARKNIA